MSAVIDSGGGRGATAATLRSNGVWSAAFRRFRRDRVGVFSLVVVALFLLLVIASGLGWVASGWQQERAVADAPPSFIGPAAASQGAATAAAPTGPNVDISAVDPLAPRYQEWAEAAKKYKTTEAVKETTLPFGADRLGRDVLAKATKGAEVSIFVGVAAAVVATLIGTLLGAVAGFFGGKVGDFLEWVYNVFTAIPDILLIFAFAAVFHRGVTSVVLILGLAGWPGMYRLMRAEFIKHVGRDYVRSAEAIGASNGSRIFRHILPNVSHVVLVRLSTYVVGFIKSEVILSYLGLGVGVDQVSWGTMLAEAQSELILGHWWQLVAATVFMAVFVTAFSLMTDALRDALDPKLRGWSEWPAVAVGRFRTAADRFGTAEPAGEFAASGPSSVSGRMKIELDDLSRPAVHALLEEHLQGMRAITPLASVHALDLAKLRSPDISFWTAWEGDLLLGCGALKDLGQRHGEIKSMRTPNALRRRGAGRALLAHIIGAARSRGFERLSLETGAGAAFQPAHALYRSAGFVACRPFEGYAADLNSVFMSLRLF